MRMHRRAAGVRRRGVIPTEPPGRPSTDGDAGALETGGSTRLMAPWGLGRRGADSPAPPWAGGRCRHARVISPMLEVVEDVRAGSPAPRRHETATVQAAAYGTETIAEKGQVGPRRGSTPATHGEALQVGVTLHQPARGEMCGDRAKAMKN